FFTMFLLFRFFHSLLVDASPAPPHFSWFPVCRSSFQSLFCWSSPPRASASRSPEGGAGFQSLFCWSCPPRRALAERNKAIRLRFNPCSAGAAPLALVAPVLDAPFSLFSSLLRACYPPL